MRIVFANAREFEKWLVSLGSVERARVVSKIDRLLEHGPAIGMPLVRRIDERIQELRVSKYRVYFAVDGDTVRILASGEKDTQVRDITRAKGRA